MGILCPAGSSTWKTNSSHKCVAMVMIPIITVKISSLFNSVVVCSRSAVATINCFYFCFAIEE